MHTVRLVPRREANEVPDDESLRVPGNVLANKLGIIFLTFLSRQSEQISIRGHPGC